MWGRHMIDPGMWVTGGIRGFGRRRGQPGAGSAGRRARHHRLRACLPVLAVVCAAGALTVPSVAAAPAAVSDEGVLATSAAVGASDPTDATLAAVPAGFSDSVVGHVELPTGLAWTPDGRMLVISKAGQLVVVQPGAGNQVALDLTSRVCSLKELGLVGLAVDPEFATNGFVYLYYTNHHGGTCTDETQANLANSVSRFVLADDNTVALDSEKVIVDHITAPGAHHIGGDLEFGADGYLYITVGDGVCTVVGPLRCGRLNNNAQLRHVPQGKVLRVDREGLPAASNPYMGQPGARRCTRPAGVGPGTGACKEIFALGFRNPFRFARQPGTSTFYVNDVGSHTWEEVNRLAKGRNYGWNVREGRCARDSTAGCGTVAGYTNPIHAYQHTAECRSITGGAFVPDGLWPGFDDAYLYADYSCGRIFKLVESSPGKFTRSRFMTDLGGPVQLRFGPHGDSQALYYLNLHDSGIHRVEMVDTNTPPVADFSYGPDGTTVSLSGAASSDPDSGDDVVSWRWDFGDGTSTVTDVPEVTHTYAGQGPFDVTLTVTDSRGLESAPVTKTVHSGEHPPAITITAPDPAARFAVGQSFTLSATATDPEDGALAGTSISWTIRRQHANHTHPFRGPETGASLTDIYPQPEDLEAAQDSWLTVSATATDSNGLQTTVTQNLLPDKVRLRFATRPRGGHVTVEGIRRQSPTVVVSWARHAIPVGAPDQRINGRRYVFQRWSDGKPRQHVIVSPRDASTYIVYFRRP
jgi:glucose/arabinose dehydrogenase